MHALSANQIATILGTTVAAGDPSAIVTAGVSTDTRKLPIGCLFVALRGENFDANDFAPQALTQGASIAIVDRWDSQAPPSTAVIQVPDTLLALQHLASWWRNQLSQLHIIALTGSNGKTSTKDLTHAVLAQAFPTNATRGNLNNHIGLPLTVLATTAEHRAAVYEMGMNHPGEIAPLAAIAKPHIAIITNIGSAHIEHLGSSENIAREKAAVASTLLAEQHLIVPHDCQHLDIIRATTPATIITTGGAYDTIRAEAISETPAGMHFTLIIHSTSTPVHLPVAGRHMVANALLAAAAGHLCGIDPAAIAHGLAHATLTSGRLRRYEKNGIAIFDDTYNANPESMIAGLETLARFTLPENGRRFAILGGMGEQGSFLTVGCQRIGTTAAQLGITLIAIGPDTQAMCEASATSLHFPDQESAVGHLCATIQPGDAAIFKGSRATRMERLMHALYPE